ncbi:PAS domain-containing sensor histidine kinase [Kaistella antarctica]|uniref:histidine kinase n=1 Tax=Kaistella antarctica TaxID=266748 RepID=A0A3S4V1R7_9FLAO|nr:ATP-binding protein [Kaistella antarctica]SEW05525.1 hypothetical protein SAMN05421765_2042 [Kaistella antarctica]VEH98442.1 Sensor histidine kinase YycG [Kaistella antarctica]
MKNFFDNAINLESLSILFSQAPVGLAMLMGEDHVVLTANVLCLEFWQKGSEVIGLPILEALPEIANQEFPKILREVYQTGTTFKGSKIKTLIEKDSVLQTYYFDFIYTPIFDTERITGISVVAIDVTEQVSTELKLKENELLFRELMEISDYSTAIYTGQDLIVTFANDQMLKSWGKTRAVIGQKLEDAIPELDGQPFAQILRDVLTTGKPYIATEDKVDLVVDDMLQSYYYSISYRPLHNASGEIYAIWNMAMNVTELVEARLKAQRAVKEYRDLAEAMPHIVWTTGTDGRLIYFNENLEILLNRSRAQIADLDFEQVIHKEDFQNLKRIWALAEVEKKIFELEFRIYDGRGEKFVWYLNRATPVLDDEGNIFQWIGASTNIDEFKKLSAQKDTFLGIASHELKTPLTSLKLYAQVLERMLRKTGDEKNAEVAKKMDIQIVKLTSLIGDLLDVTKINSGKIHLNKEDFDFEKLALEIIEDQQMSTSYQIEFKTKSVGMVFADRDRVGQVMTNLISNAIKYAPNTDKIIVQIIEANGNVEFSVEDFGIGMPADKKDRVFEQYYRVSGDDGNTFPGIGLGLFISAEIVERSNGKIWVESVLEKGSTFSFSLPQVKS